MPLKDIFSIAAATVTILLFMGGMIAGIVLWWGRKWWEPLGTREDLRRSMDKNMTVLTERIDTGLHSIREDVHTSLGRMEHSATERHKTLTRDLERIDGDVTAALNLAQIAKDVAVEAKHDAEVARLKGGGS